MIIKVVVISRLSILVQLLPKQRQHVINIAVDYNQRLLAYEIRLFLFHGVHAIGKPFKEEVKQSMFDFQCVFL